MSSSETRGFSELGLTVCFVTPVTTVIIPVTSPSLPEAYAVVTPELVLVLAAGPWAWWQISEDSLFRFHFVFHLFEQNRALILIYTCLLIHRAIPLLDIPIYVILPLRTFASPSTTYYNLPMKLIRQRLIARLRNTTIHKYNYFSRW